MNTRKLGFAWYYIIVALLVPAYICGQNEKDVSVPAPELLNTVYYLDAAKNALTTLERQTARVSAAPASPFARRIHVFAEIQSERSPVRIDADSSQTFIVSLAAGVDPSKYQLCGGDVKNGKRRVELSPVGLSGVYVSQNSIPIAIKRYGDAAYELAPVKKLFPGEYCFNTSDSSNESFCFGIDAKK